MRLLRILPFLVFSGLLLLIGPSFADEIKKIQDNSFLLEEAYNQEDGVIQHIQVFQYQKKSKDWQFSFTQEWPAPKQTHQFSYTIPVAHLDGEDTTGIGDVLLNYRYQTIMQDRVALSPRLSLILPTGDYKKGLGTDTVGYQINIPLSVELSDMVVTHWNMGATFTPRAKDIAEERANLRGFNYGASLIYLVNENFNLMLETAGTSVETSPVNGLSTTESTFFINPGMRFAINFRSGLQVVPGFSIPIGVGPSEGEYGGLLYLSFEHPLF